MTITPAPPSRHPGAAAAASLAVLVVAFVLSVLDGVVGVVYTQGQTLESLDGFDYALPALGWAVPYALWQLVPLTAGVFLSFWLILPIRPRHRVGQVVLRAFVALVIGVVVAGIVAAARLLATDLPVNPSSGDGRYYVLVVGTLAHSAWQVFSDTLGLVVAAGLAMWGWLHTRPAYGPLRRSADETVSVDAEV
ncbi:hypothetical protein HD599_002131 [Conyzicola lurida]|uniref:Uncharacterized protein n=1 Tax=Conyzicola lurida TaxID=1172621 RepID=A0A841AN92_9MICO|nr:hypothetical protein [Conyzicola lurida]MBB5843808.1 hypothetical protein [Conyzicola lurida]